MCWKTIEKHLFTHRKRKRMQFLHRLTRFRKAKNPIGHFSTTKTCKSGSIIITIIVNIYILLVVCHYGQYYEQYLFIHKNNNRILTQVVCQIRRNGKLRRLLSNTVCPRIPSLYNKCRRSTNMFPS